MNNTLDVTLYGESAGDEFGTSVSSAGDVNGDGYSDVIVGAPDYGGGSFSGKAYIFLGGSSMNNIPDVIMTGGSGDNLGFSVSAAGDVNGDGYSDVIVGARLNDSAGTDAGSVYIYFGGSIMNNVSDLTLSGGAANDYFGNKVSSAGDVNNDGYSDVIVGAPFNDAGGSDAGRAYVYFGGSSMNNVPDLIITGAAGDRLGLSVSTAGDINNDGYSDVITGAHCNDAGGTDAGRVYIYLGGITIDNTADIIMTGSTAGEFFGSSVSTAGDVNGDGFSDVIIGSSENDAGGADAGRSFIYFGGFQMDNSPDIISTGSVAGDRFGKSVSNAGDINSDGLSDVVIGTPYAGALFSGRAYLYVSSSPSVKPVLTIVKDVPNDQGGFVNMKWARSGYDVYGNDLITYYLIERSNPPSGGDFAWEDIAHVTANKNPFYSYTSNTPYDSGAFYFRITAKTNLSSQYWRSNILSGRSIDNISPIDCR